MRILGNDGKPLAEPGSVAAPTWQALYLLNWDQKYAYWFRLNPEETHLVFDIDTGKLIREQSLIKGRGLPAVGSLQREDTSFTATSTCAR